jgi:signal transduction histidine kinase
MSVSRYLRDIAVFAPCYVALDWASYIYPLGPFNITPWNPQPALAIVWLLLGGLQYFPAVLGTIFVADVVVRHAPGGYGIALVTAVTLACGYAAIAWLLRTFLRPTPGLRSTRELTIFALIVVGGTAAVGAAFVGALWLMEYLAETRPGSAWVQFWVGDAVGVLVTAPLLMAAADAERRDELLQLVRRPETLLQIVVLAAALWIVFKGLGGDPSRHFYLLFPPLIWIAVRGGMSGAVVATATVQLGVVLAIHRETNAALPVVELQAFVAALTLTALYIGMMVDERTRTAERLKQTLRLAAAGEMAGAVAHEVNQPLTALANYGESAQMLLAEGGAAVEELPAVIRKMVAEGERAAEVVRRLRDFFRTGTTRLEPVPVADLVSAAQRIGRQLIGSRPITIEATADRDLPPLFVDRLQIELVLRNLIANATEALGEKAGGHGRVSVVVQRAGPHRLRVVVADSGPGLATGVRERLFEPFVSGKSSGMGLGLAVSRAIAEAHGGSLDVGPSDRGEFHLVLPCVQPH